MPAWQPHLVSALQGGLSGGGAGGSRQAGRRQQAQAQQRRGLHYVSPCRGGWQFAPERCTLGPGLATACWHAGPHRTSNAALQGLLRRSACLNRAERPQLALAPRSLALQAANSVEWQEEVCVEVWCGL